ncbi:unnamed protein product [Pedinophyceae sp. YPF-701]|nr:unnamed protein product [Pedinophyceae sp. YPF-701]
MENLPATLPFSERINVKSSQVFAATELSYAFVNLMPVLPGHVLVSPRRIAPRFSDLSGEEVADLWQLAQRVSAAIVPHFGCTSTTFAIQDGPDSGQTVAHVHIHILPRKPGDFKKNDEVYDAIEKSESDMSQAAEKAGESKGMDAEDGRKPRTPEEMDGEAAALRQVMAAAGRA